MIGSGMRAADEPRSNRSVFPCQVYIGGLNLWMLCATSTVTVYLRR